MVKLFLILTTVSCTMAFAATESEYLDWLKKEEQRLQQLGEKISSGDRSLCPKVNGKDRSSCLRDYISKMDFPSTSHVVFMTSLALKVAQADKAMGYSGSTAILMLIDNSLLALERTYPSKFKVFTMAVKSDAERKQLKDIRKAELELLYGKTPELLSMLEKKLAEVESSQRAPATAWEKAKTADLKTRLANARKSLASVASQSGDEKALRMVLEQESRKVKSKLCESAPMRACYKFEREDCPALVDKTMESCRLEAKRRPAMATKGDPYDQAFFDTVIKCFKGNVKGMIKENSKLTPTPACQRALNAAGA